MEMPRSISERDAVRDKLLQRQLARKNQPGGFGLQIDIGAIGPKQHTFSYANVRSGNFDSFRCGSLGEEQDLGARPGNAYGLFD